MKTTEQPMVHRETTSLMSKPKRKDEVFGLSSGEPSFSRMSPIPIEWLDPDCWRLPSGKALAEFALQAGFLAPLMLGMPKPKRHEANAAAKPAVAEGSSKSEPSGQCPPTSERRRLTREKMGRPASGGGKR